MEWSIWILAVAVVFVAVVASNRRKARDSATEEFLSVFWYCPLEEFESLISGGADVNAKTRSYTPEKWGRPLHNLATRGDDPKDLEKIRVLLRSGADVDGLNSEGRTPLVCLVESAAALGDWGKAASLLISQGAKTDQINMQGATLLHTAAWAGRFSVVQVLLDAGADIDARAPLTSIFILHGDSAGTDVFGNVSRTTQGALPLHFAAANVSVDVARIFLENGANANSRTADGITPLAIIQANRAKFSKDIAKGDTWAIRRKGSLDAFEALILANTN